jgi:hypothetical protein
MSRQGRNDYAGAASSLSASGIEGEKGCRKNFQLLDKKIKPHHHGPVSKRN